MDDLAFHQLVSDFLEDTFSLIPIIFADDPRTQLLLQSQKSNMIEYTKKMWWALGARSVVDYVTLTINMGHAFVAAKPKVVHSCETYAAYADAQLAWIEKELNLTLTAADHEAKNALMLLGHETATVINKKLQALHANKKG